MKSRIYLSPPQLAGNEERYLKEAVESNWIAPLGPFVDRFERDLCALTGARYCVALSSGTAALHLILLALGVQEGDLVICSDLTFVASANAIRYCGATPLLIDSDRKSWNIDPQRVEDQLQLLKKEGKRAAAILPTHLYGMPCAMDELLDISRRWNVPIVEDAAEAVGSTQNGQSCGTFGVAGALSFNGNKIATTSGGGAVVTDDPEIEKRVRHLATQARLPAMEYLHDEIGYNYRLSNLLAAVGCGQIEQIEKKVEARRTLYERYSQELPNIISIEEQMERENSRSNRWLSTFLLPKPADRDRLLKNLSEENIEARPCWNPMSCQPLYRRKGVENRIAQEIYQRGICLPSGIAPDSEEWERVITALRR